jgi:hypothetical protein
MIRTVRNLVFAALAAAVILPAADMLSGTWKMNPIRSKYDPGPAPRSMTTKVSMEGDWVVTTTESVSADGKPASYTYRYKLDGKEYPYKTAAAEGTILVRRIDDHHSESTFKGAPGGSTVGNLVISKDGKTRTITTTGTSGDGKPIRNVVVYDKQ